MGGGLDGGLVGMMAEFVPAAAIWEVSKRTSVEMGYYLLGDHSGFLLGTVVSLGSLKVNTILAIEALS